MGTCIDWSKSNDVRITTIRSPHIVRHHALQHEVNNIASRGKNAAFKTRLDSVRQFLRTLKDFGRYDARCGCIHRELSEASILTVNLPPNSCKNALCTKLKALQLTAVIKTCEAGLVLSVTRILRPIPCVCMYVCMCNYSSQTTKKTDLHKNYTSKYSVLR